MRELVDAGMDVARLNLSHGSYADHEEVYLRVRRASDAAGHGVGVLVDLQGPKIRLGRLASGPVGLREGDQFTITTEQVPATPTEVSTTYLGLAGDVQAGDRLLIDDGKVGLRCLRVDGPRVVTTVTEGGMISNNKGINLPGVEGQRSGAVRQGHRRPALGLAPAGRHDRAVVRRARRATSTTCTGSWTRRVSGCR